MKKETVIKYFRTVDSFKWPLVEQPRIGAVVTDAGYIFKKDYEIDGKVRQLIIEFSVDEIAKEENAQIIRNYVNRNKVDKYVMDENLGKLLGGILRRIIIHEEVGEKKSLRDG